MQWRARAVARHLAQLRPLPLQLAQVVPLLPPSFLCGAIFKILHANCRGGTTITGPGIVGGMARIPLSLLVCSQPARSLLADLTTYTRGGAPGVAFQGV